jgi:hypothetical protein
MREKSDTLYKFKIPLFQFSCDWSTIVAMNNSELLNQYEINLKYVFEDKTLQKIFSDFLKKELSQETLSFLIEVNSLSNKKMSPQDIKKVIHIKKEYLESGSPQEINLDSTSKFEILQQFEDSKQEMDLKNWKFSQDPKTLFSKIWSRTWSSLYFDKKSNFIRTPEFIEFALKNLKNESFLKKKPIEILKYSVNDFNLPIFTEKDKRFFKNLSNDNYDWDLFYKKNGTFCYYAMRDYLPNVPAFHPSESMCLKWEWTVPYSIEDVLKVHFHDISSFRMNSPGVTHFDLQNILTNEDQLRIAKENNYNEEIDNHGVIQHTFNIVTPGPMQNLIAPLISTLYLEQDEVVYAIKYATSTRDNQIPLKKQKGEFYTKKDKKVDDAEYCVMMLLGQYRFTSLDDNTTKVSCTAIQNYSIKELDMSKYSKKMGEMRAQGLKSFMIRDMKTFMPKMEEWSFEDFQGQNLLKVLEEYKNREIKENFN